MFYFLQEMRVLYEVLSSRGTDTQMSSNEVQGMVTCYLRLGEPSTALSHIYKHLEDSPEMPLILTEVHIYGFRLLYYAAFFGNV